MAQVKIEHVFKRFGNVTAVGDFNVTVADGEFSTVMLDLPVVVKQLHCEWLQVLRQLQKVKFI